MEKAKIQPVTKIFCPNCKELMVKFYPWSSLRLQEGANIPLCGKCQNDLKKKEGGR